MKQLDDERCAYFTLPSISGGNSNECGGQCVVIVKASSGPRYVVSYRPTLPVAKLKMGTRVSLDMTTLTIMRILPREVDPLVYKMSLEDPGGASFAGIGGLGEQVRELREVRPLSYFFLLCIRRLLPLPTLLLATLALSLHRLSSCPCSIPSSSSASASSRPKASCSTAPRGRARRCSRGRSPRRSTRISLRSSRARSLTSTLASPHVWFGRCSGMRASTSRASSSWTRSTPSGGGGSLRARVRIGRSSGRSWRCVLLFH